MSPEEKEIIKNELTKIDRRYIVNNFDLEKHRKYSSYVSSKSNLIEEIFYHFGKVTYVQIHFIG